MVLSYSFENERHTILKTPLLFLLSIDILSFAVSPSHLEGEALNIDSKAFLIYYFL